MDLDWLACTIVIPGSVVPNLGVDAHKLWWSKVALTLRLFYMESFYLSVERAPVDV